MLHKILCIKPVYKCMFPNTYLVTTCNFMGWRHLAVVSEVIHYAMSLYCTVTTAVIMYILPFSDKLHAA
jgi:hypothetical protein